MRLAILGDAANPHIQRWTSYLVKRKYDVHLISFQFSSIYGVQLHLIELPKYLVISQTTSFWRKIGYLTCLRKVRQLIHDISPDGEIFIFH